MLNRGVLFHPGAYENLFLSFAHDEEDVDQTLEAARETLIDMRDR
ncbi:MAG: hemL [Rubritepida sp.]|nr:hemL [Rubritepida sp.]